MEILYKPTFLRDFKKLPADIQEEAREKINLFKNASNHQRLKVHKLQGKLGDFYSFSITYSHRIVFAKESKEIIVFIAIGDHDVYR